MENGNLTLCLYTQILAASKRMLDLARAQEWDALVDQELDRREIVAKLRTTLEQKPTPHEVAEHTQSEALIREILAIDEETRNLAQSWMAELDQQLNSLGTSKRLRNTYLNP